MKESQVAVAGGGRPETGEGDTFRQNTFSNICLCMESAHKTTQGIFNFQLWPLMKWANAYAPTVGNGALSHKID